MSTKRRYTQRARAIGQAETRARIIEAAMQLHEEIGPRATSISAIAKRAGVQRLTLYRHFLDDTAVFEACTAHWLSLHPPPDPSEWARIDAAIDRTRAALTAFYAYYRGTARMWSVSYRDAPEVPALQEPMARFRAFTQRVGDDLTAQLVRRSGPERRIAVTLHHALSFGFWESMAGQDLADAEMVDLVISWLGCLDAPAGISGGTTAPIRRSSRLP
jgi:AcrR family transcriptional regulator